MPLATASGITPQSSTLTKMEERKRPAITSADDLAPPSKRQAVNGGNKTRDDNTDSREEAWIEVGVTRRYYSPSSL
jgi:E3 ubiquitin-protein ligase BRE1